MDRSIKKILIFSALALVVYACSTEKDRWINRGYHNMTARYNGYFNAKELMKQSMRSFKETYPEDYTQVIPVFVYPSDEEAQSLYQPMEKAIEKTSVVIAKHSMPDPEVVRSKREEWCKWIDDNWLAMGQAFFYKRYFKEAKKNFKYIIATYPGEPIMWTAKLWLAKTHIEEENYAEAISLLEELETEFEKQNSEEFEEEMERVEERLKRRYSDREDWKEKLEEEMPTPMPKGIEDDVATVFADIHVRREEWPQAADRLGEAIDLVRKRDFKTRLTFILAQVYQKLGDNSSSSHYYSRVVKMTPPYEMAFYAKINRALMFEGGSSRAIKAELLKMLKDEKNIEFRDQIYYALAEIELTEGNKEQGIDYLKQSSIASTGNTKQQSKTFLRLGNIYYDDKEFPLAKAYYDSCVTTITDEHPEYDQIIDRSKGLTELVENLHTVEFQDSVRALEAKGQKVYLEVINDIIAELKRQKEEEMMNPQIGNQPGVPQNGKNPSGAGKWYFYNQQTMSFGFTEFRRLWGERKNEDDWRRSNKSSFTSEFGDDEAAEDDSLAGGANDPMSPEYYLKDLPITEEQKEDSDDKVAFSLYTLGTIYKERLGDIQTAIDYWTELEKRFGHSMRSLPGLYQLYLAHKQENNSTEMKKYEQAITTKFPDSEYAAIIRNPEFKKEAELAKKEHEVEYQKTYSKFLAGNYQAVITDCEKVINNQSLNTYKPKYLLLKAYALGETKGKEVQYLKPPLEKLIADYPETKEGELAKGILERLKAEASKELIEEGRSTYLYNPQMSHFFIMLFPNEGVSGTSVKTSVSRFNDAYFGSSKLNVSGSFLNRDTQILLVKSFKNKDEALKYFKAFKANKNQLKGINDKGWKSYVISHKNYSAFFIEKDVEAYEEFFEANYE